MVSLKMITIIPLGTNGWFPSYGRETMSFLVVLKKRLIILDAGSGLFRLFKGKLNLLINKYKEIDLYFSHFHLDHLMGFQYLHQVFKCQVLNIFGPSKKINSFSPKEALNRYVNHPFYSYPISKFPFKIVFYELANKTYNFGGYQVKVREQKHPLSSLAFNFNFGLSYITDSDCTQKTVDFVKGSKLLLHEHWRLGNHLLKKRETKIEDYLLDGHTSTIGAAIIAKKARVSKLGLIHHYPFFTKKILKNAETLAQQVFKPTKLIFDLEKIIL